ncbi:unnamed protein product [Discosporangium mesarthrocarpum]
MATDAAPGSSWPFSTIVCLALSISLLVRQLVSLWPYSGAGTPPMYGDYEAQRHWMEVTVNLPIGEWYRYDLPYWGLDYPPLTAYVSWACGTLSRFLDPPSMVLDSSRGYETASHKTFMRLTVLTLDLFIYFPAAFILARRIWEPFPFHGLNTSQGKARQSKAESNVPLSSPTAGRVETSRFSATSGSCAIFALALLQPSLVLIDHGHFQYNSVCLGLAMGAAAAVLRGGKMGGVLGSILFSLSLNFKQMALYYAPAFFFSLLAWCVSPARGETRGGLHLTRQWFGALGRVLMLGVTVVATFVCLWGPFCVYHHTSRTCDGSTCLSSLGQILARQFPFSRGLFEDKVANLWFCADVVFNIRQRLALPQLVKMALMATLCLVAPVGVELMRPGKTLSPQRLVLALVNSSLAFFLCSFQVHEKSVLLPLCPLAFLWADSPMLVTWMQVVGAFSLWPLLCREGLGLPCIVSISLYVIASTVLTSLTGAGSAQRKTVGMVFPFTRFFTHSMAQWMVTISGLCMVGLFVAELTIQPPQLLPHLYPTLNAGFSCTNLVCAYVLCLYWQWVAADGSRGCGGVSREKQE